MEASWRVLCFCCLRDFVCSAFAATGGEEVPELKLSVCMPGEETVLVGFTTELCLVSLRCSDNAGFGGESNGFTSASDADDAVLGEISGAALGECAGEAFAGESTASSSAPSPALVSSLARSPGDGGSGGLRAALRSSLETELGSSNASVACGECRADAEVMPGREFAAVCSGEGRLIARRELTRVEIIFCESTTLSGVMNQGQHTFAWL